MKMKIIRMEHNKHLPEYKTEGSSGMDLYAAIDTSFRPTACLYCTPALIRPFGPPSPRGKAGAFGARLEKKYFDCCIRNFQLLAY